MPRFNPGSVPHFKTAIVPNTDAATGAAGVPSWTLRLAQAQGGPL